MISLKLIHFQVIDISHDEPPYTTNDPSHIRYVKVATTSKIPPTPAEVARFIAVVNDFWKAHPRSHIGVHCHYGFNRTGFMICAYMVEERGMSVADALQEWAKARPPGIRHAHFHDELFLRYV